MTSLSGVACILGASVICIDIIIRQFPGKRDFRIQDSDTFLSMSLSLSFGVMLFSALYSMLPSAKKSLQEGGYSPKEASWILIVCFIGGVVGIQLISRVLHQYVPSHVVDCEHNHEEEGPKEDVEAHSHAPAVVNRSGRSRTNSLPGHTPLGPKTKQPASKSHSHIGTSAGNANGSVAEPENHYEEFSKTTSAPDRRPSLQQRLTSGISKLTSRTKANCDCDGPCYGFSDVCGSECFKNVNANGGARGVAKPAGVSSRPSMVKSGTATTLAPLTENTPLLQHIDEESAHDSVSTRQASGSVSGDTNASASNPTSEQTLAPEQNSHSHSHSLHKTRSHETTSSHNPDHHHHHVPQNAFLSIGLQTSIAIALHKLPEGFITYATNHANPKLGVAVFLALFIHNITEGFAMALPLYLALNSRTKAMATSFVLGGLSQPIGAAVAALWFHVAGNGDWAPSEGVYGGMFAATAGIMASVALQLFSESLDLTHSRGLCMIGAFMGMGILGVSSALTA